MARRDKNTISSGFIARFILVLIRIFTLPIRRPFFCAFLVGFLIVLPIVSGGEVKSHNDLLAWYSQKINPASEMIKDVSNNFIKHTGIKKATADFVEEKPVIEKVLTSKLNTTLSKPLSNEIKPIVDADESIKKEYNYMPIVVAQKDAESEYDEYADFEQPDQIITGSAKTMGGDRLMINGKLIRLDGIRVARGDADLKAKRFLDSIINNKEVECLIFEYTENNIPLGWCFIAEQEINALMVERGFALNE